MNLAVKNCMNIAITLNCDCQCKHCYIDSLENGDSNDLDVSYWKKALKFYSENGLKEVSIHGGEPILYENIGDILLYAHKLGLKTSIISNLIHLDDDLIDILKRTSTYVLTSLDGPESNYLKFRGTDKFGVILKKVNKLLKNNIKVHPIFIVHKKNFLDLSWITNYSLFNNIPVVTLSPIQPIGRADNLKEYILSNEDLYVVINKIIELNEKYKGKVNFVTQSLYRPEDLNNYVEDEDKLKEYNDKFLNILNDGSIIADFDLPNQKEYSLGNIVGNPKNLNKKTYNNYKKLLNKVYKIGLKKLKDNKSINWLEEVQIVAKK